MAVDVKIENSEKNPECEFPCLMIAENGMVVLFTDKSTGTVLLKSHDGVWNIGHYSDIWEWGNFYPFKGSITLSNKK